MKENPATNLKDFDYLRLKEKGTSFQRKGQVGGWKTYFTEEQNTFLEKRVTDKLSGTGLSFNYE